jgi:hypothetical protein
MWDVPPCFGHLITIFEHVNNLLGLGCSFSIWWRLVNQRPYRLPPLCYVKVQHLNKIRTASANLPTSNAIIATYILCCCGENCLWRCLERKEKVPKYWSCKVLLHRADEVPRTPHYNGLMNTVIISDKYDLVEVFAPWSSLWPRKWIDDWHRKRHEYAPDEPF